MTGTRRRAAALLVGALLLVPLGVTVVAAIEDPEISAFVSSPNLEPGQTVELTVQLVNEDRQGGDPVATAENLRATLSAGDSPVDVRSGTLVVGDIPDGGEAEVTFTVRVPVNATPGEYELPVELEYIADDELVQRGESVTVRVEPAPRFVVVSTETSASVGDRGTFTVVLRNAGSAPARDATVRLASEDPALTFAGAAVTESYVGRWAPGEAQNVTVPVDVAEGSSVRSFAIQATIDYENREGEARSRSIPLPASPVAEPTFAVEAVESDLRVGDRGTLRADVGNTGGSTARDATVLLTTSWANLTAPLEYPVGDLEPGASAPVSFSLDVPPGLDPGPVRATFRVEHTTSAGERRVSPPIDATLQLGPRRSPIAVDPVNATFEVGETGQLRLRLTNRATGPITALRATLTPTDPFTSDDPSAFVQRLGPGESATVSFQLDVSDDAVPGDHPVSVAFAYDDEDGNLRQVADVPVGVDVVEPAGSGFPIAAAAVVLVVLAAGAVWWYRRR